MILFLILNLAAFQIEANSNFSKIKNQVSNLVLVNQRNVAVNMIDNELKRVDGDNKNKLNDLKFNILNEFLSLPAQEAFEIAAPIILSDRKKTLLHTQQCLSFEPDNLQCQWLELKYLKKYNFNSFVEKSIVYIESIKDFRQSQLLKYTLSIALNHFNEVPAQIKFKPTTPEESLLIHIINYDLAIQTHDFNRAKEAINYLKIQASDYPDLIFMNYQVSLLWPEKYQTSSNDLEKQIEVYQKKCADLPGSLERKYFLDISLCTRSLKL